MKTHMYRWIRKKQDRLKRATDRRFQGLWMGDAPELLTRERLLAGDVLFCGQSKQDKRTELIQKTTDGVYVHCGVYIGNGSVVDARSNGMRETSLEQFVADYSYIAVTRSHGAHEERSKKIVQFARRCVEYRLRYNLLGAILVPLREYLNLRKHYFFYWKQDKRRPRKPTWASTIRKGYFCSEFVVQCYVECGYVDEEQTYYHRGNWSPTGLAEENLFEFLGFMATGGLAAVSPDDPYLAGNAWVLTPEGQHSLKQHRQDMKAEMEALLRRIPRKEE
ncbi:YiiX/YebB-like N1pC/P60 family cysteine hydrolase [Achromobacter aegrifaciens]|uniref:YiiX/YebB-like N1pC/P60 family cysteine hydrolase n=1 Tax=Achromobacter aegrifaciens TaxID=1287736 RepID=UPI0028B193F9|nr:YiiX/YebB-like N1pC/P60 family cysteine hydrolase [Achromobacter aegrifaciens]